MPTVQTAEPNSVTTDLSKENSQKLNHLSSTELFEIEKHTIKCSDKFDKLAVEVSVQKEKQLVAHQRCFILTVHNLGFDNTQYEEFINSVHMAGIRMRTVWLHVTLPGQERDAADLNLRKYPTLEELADELVTVLDYFQLQQVVLMGEGVGATICGHFAIKHSHRCHGLLLLEPVVSTAGVLESMKYKLNRTGFMGSRKSSLTNSERSNSLSISVTSDSQSLNENETFHLNPVSDGNDTKYMDKNVKNMSLFSEAFLNRTCLLDQIANLSVDCFIATGKQSANYNEAKRLFRSIQLNNRKSPEKMVNTDRKSVV